MTDEAAKLAAASHLLLRAKLFHFAAGQIERASEREEQQQVVAGPERIAARCPLAPATCSPAHSNRWWRSGARSEIRLDADCASDRCPLGAGSESSATNRTGGLPCEGAPAANRWPLSIGRRASAGERPLVCCPPPAGRSQVERETNE